MGKTMYFLKKRTVFFKLSGSGIFHYPSERLLSFRSLCLLAQT